MLKRKQKPNQQNTHVTGQKREKTVFLEPTQDTQSNDIQCILTKSI